MQYEQLSWDWEQISQSSSVDELVSVKKETLGHSKVYYKEFSSILTKASGFMNAFDYTLNPYSGCTFGCTYCYAAFFSKTGKQRDEWGYWVQVKENAECLLKKYREKPLDGKTIYMSSVTDPYQPIEKETGITRSLLEELVNHHEPYLVIQTRSPLVIRDIDILKQFKNLQVNMTVTTDSDKVRKVFEPFCSSINARLSAIEKLTKAGIKTCITMTPLLPVSNPYKFVEQLLETGVQKFVVQPFHPDKGKFVAGTREPALVLVKEMKWGIEAYKSTVDILRNHLPNLGEGKEGFSTL